MSDRGKEKNGQKKVKKGFFSKLFRGSKECGCASCCDIKIVPQEEPEEPQKKEQLAGDDN
ncbi:MAG: hypothetical protein PHW73_12515 [Atribacterota bacterium]|nr:hypothetical protein [Atribacterota bacterium]